MKKNKKPIILEEEGFGRRLELALAISLLFLIVIFATFKSVKLESAPIRSHITRFDTIIDFFTDVYTPPPPQPPQPTVKPPVIEVNKNSEENASEEKEKIEQFTSDWIDNPLPPPPEPKEEKVYTYAMVQVKPRLIKKVLPQYPELARKASIEGRVVLKVIVDTTGHVKSVEVVQSDNEIFNAPAIEAVKQFEFTPAMQNDRKVPVALIIPIRFELDR